METPLTAVAVGAGTRVEADSEELRPPASLSTPSLALAATPSSSPPVTRRSTPFPRFSVSVSLPSRSNPVAASRPRCRGCYMVVVEIDPHKVELAAHNARIYGVEDRIEFVVGDFFRLAPFLKADLVFLSPPWRGPSYNQTPIYTLDMLKPKDGDQTKEVLISAAFVHLTQADLSKHIRNLSAASRAILLSGPTEPYLQSLARALSRYYRTRLLLLDVTDFSLRIQSKYGSISKALVRNQSISEATLGRMSGFIGSFITFPNKDEPTGPDPVVLDVTAIAADRILLLNSYFTVVIFHGITIAQWRNAGYQDQEGHEVYGQLKAPDEEADTIIKERYLASQKVWAQRKTVWISSSMTGLYQR